MEEGWMGEGGKGKQGKTQPIWFPILEFRLELGIGCWKEAMPPPFNSVLKLVSVVRQNIPLLSRDE